MDGFDLGRDLAPMAFRLGGNGRSGRGVPGERSSVRTILRGWHPNEPAIPTPLGSRVARGLQTSLAILWRWQRRARV
jgi:hypothetical protein